MKTDNRHGPGSIAAWLATISLGAATLPGCDSKSAHQEQEKSGDKTAQVSPSQHTNKAGESKKTAPEIEKFTPPKDSIDTDQAKATLARTVFNQLAIVHLNGIKSLEGKISKNEVTLTTDQAKTFAEIQANGKILQSVLNYSQHIHAGGDAGVNFANSSGNPKYNPSIGENNPKDLVKKGNEALLKLNKEIKK